MTTLAPTATAGRTRLRTPTPERRILVLGVIAAAFLLTQGVAQAVTPFIRQDDWPFLLPAGTRGVLPTSYYNLSEGRWLNSAWWAVVGQHGTATTAALSYAVGYAALVAGMWRVCHRAGIRPRPAVDALLGIALFASCVWVQLLYWPGTLTPSVFVAAGALWLLPWAARTPMRLGLWLVLGEIAAVLTYPPIGVVLLVFAVVLLRDAPWRRLLRMAAVWVAGFALGVGVAYTLNWIVYGHFGIQLAGWRRFNPLTSLDALGVNAGRWFETAGSLWAAQWWALLVGLVGIVLGWRDPTVRPRLQRLLLAFAIAYALDGAQTLATGVVTEARGQLWTWLFAVLPVALLLIGRRRPAPIPTDHKPPVDRIATVLLAVLALGGVLAWRADIGEHQATRMQYAAIAATAAEHGPRTATPTVVVYQDPALRYTREGRIMASTLFMAVHQELDGVLPRWCIGVECRQLAQRAGSGPVIRLGSVGGPDRVVGVIVPTPPSWL
ncbi:hypothetical protein [Intrasporangium sp.]|uniref:hypothetical protein n=1 Tax=Intrasporangium sp. TaxID=1925024 RepID=UPI003365828E